MHDSKHFLRVPRLGFAARPITERIQDFRHVYEAPAEPRVGEQAKRCMGCGVPFCHGPHGCPVENLIPDWNELVSRGRYRDALNLLHATNNFPEFTGMLCPAPCESACVLALNDSSVTIRQIELAIIDRGFESGWVSPEPAQRRLGQSVAVVGSGPAGLACAQQLARKGYDVTVYEKADRPGGLLRYGIPDFKLEKSVLDRRLRQLAGEGVRFLTGVTLGQDLTLVELSEKHHAVCLTIGAERPRELAIPGRDLSGVHLAMDYLMQQNRRIAGDEMPGRIDAAGKNVIVIGGGDTGSDCVGTAHRQGAKSVRQFELMAQPPATRSVETPWPLWPMRLTTSHAHEEGGVRHFGIATTSFSGRDGVVQAVNTVQVERRDGGIHPISGTETVMPADLVVLAIGFAGPIVPDDGELTRTPMGLLQTNKDFMTDLPGVFAAGDARRGASLIVWAIAEGRQMAQSVDRFLRH